MTHGIEKDLALCLELRKICNRLTYLEALLLEPFDFPFKKLHSNAQLPSKSGELEACYDIKCVGDDEFERPDSVLGVEKGVSCPFVLLERDEIRTFHTGLACAIPEGRALYLWDRSGMGAKRNIHRLAGVIDCTYRGELLVCLANLSNQQQLIEEGDKIVQGQLALVLPGNPVWVDDLPDSYRGEAGFGSTGR